MGASKIAAPRLASLIGQLGLDAEVVVPERNGLQQLGADHLVAGLHVAQVEVGRHVDQRGQQAVAEAVVEQQHPPVVAGEEPGAEDGVGLLVEEGLHQARQVARVVLEVRVVGHAHVAGGVGERRPERRALALVALVLDVADGRQLPGQRAQHLARAVGGPVVHDDDFQLADGRIPDGQHAPERRRDQEALVVDRYQNGDLQPFRHPPSSVAALRYFLPGTPISVMAT